MVWGDVGHCGADTPLGRPRPPTILRAPVALKIQSLALQRVAAAALAFSGICCTSAHMLRAWSLRKLLHSELERADAWALDYI